MGVSQVPGLEQNYQYGLYGQGSKIPFGGLTVGPKVQPATTIEPTTGISVPTQYAHVNNENGEKISLGQDGYGLRHIGAEEMEFKGISKMFIA